MDLSCFPSSLPSVDTHFHPLLLREIIIIPIEICIGEAMILFRRGMAAPCDSWFTKIRAYLNGSPRHQRYFRDLEVPPLCPFALLLLKLSIDYLSFTLGARGRRRSRPCVRRAHVDGIDEKYETVETVEIAKLLRERVAAPLFVPPGEIYLGNLSVEVLVYGDIYIYVKIYVCERRGKY